MVELENRDQGSGIRGQKNLLVEVRTFPGLRIETWGTQFVGSAHSEKQLQVLRLLAALVAQDDNAEIGE